MYINVFGFCYISCVWGHSLVSYIFIYIYIEREYYMDELRGVGVESRSPGATGCDGGAQSVNASSSLESYVSRHSKTRAAPQTLTAPSQ